MTIAQLIDELRRHHRDVEVLIDDKYSIESLTYTSKVNEGITYISLNTPKEDNK